MSRLERLSLSLEASTNMKFNIGDKAVEKKLIQPYTSYPVMQVVGKLDEFLLLTWWGDCFDGDLIQQDYLLDSKPGTRSFREGIMRFDEEEIFTPQEAHAEQKRLESEKSKLDAEFSKVQKEIEKKLHQAAMLVKEASALAKPLEKDLFDLKNEGMELYRALSAGGWSHSHMKC